MIKIAKFIECLIPITLCNLKCHYCYVIQRENRGMRHATFEYPISHMIKCLSKERFGGAVYFSICGAGETMLCPELPELVKGLLSSGHVVNITTNGTCTKQMIELLGTLTDEESKALHFSFSFHYLELKRLGKIDVFFDNVNRAKNNGCSFFVQFNLNDEYIPYLEEIKKLALNNTGALPQVMTTRKENDLKSDIELYTKKSKDEYVKYGREFDSPLFEYTMSNFDRKRKEYCYAGQVSYVLNLATGILQACYASVQKENIFKHPDKPIEFKPMGHRCASKFCMNSSHFMALGVIPDRNEATYAGLRNRKSSDGADWYNDFHKEFLSQHLPVRELSYIDKTMSDLKVSFKKIVLKTYSLLPEQFKNIYRKHK